MTPRRSAGLLLYRSPDTRLEVMLVHMGGPFWARKDAGAWSIPKGEQEHGEDALAAARREFSEETGRPAPGGEPIDLGLLQQSRDKAVHVWALEADIDVSEIASNSFALEWPRGSGRMCEFPEADRADWFDVQCAGEKLVKGQVPVLEMLATRLRERSQS
jgi:predicted NUDIX family NTP pyrophosphohydrolase